MAEFQEITTQEQLDQIIDSRLARAKEKWEKESVPKEQAEALSEESTVLGRELEAKSVR